MAQKVDDPLLVRYLNGRASQQEVLRRYTSVTLDPARLIKRGGNPLVSKLLAKGYRVRREIRAAVRDGDRPTAKAMWEASRRNDGRVEGACGD